MIACARVAAQHARVPYAARLSVCPRCRRRVSRAISVRRTASATSSARWGSRSTTSRRRGARCARSGCAALRTRRPPAMSFCTHPSHIPLTAPRSRGVTTAALAAQALAVGAWAAPPPGPTRRRANAVAGLTRATTHRRLALRTRALTRRRAVAAPATRHVATARTARSRHVENRHVESRHVETNERRQDRRATAGHRHRARTSRAPPGNGVSGFMGAMYTITAAPPRAAHAPSRLLFGGRGLETRSSQRPRGRRARGRESQSAGACLHDGATPTGGGARRAVTPDCSRRQSRRDRRRQEVVRKSTARAPSIRRAPVRGRTVAAVSLTLITVCSQPAPGCNWTTDVVN